jgi:preprotein translocase SecE subunit
MPVAQQENAPNKPVHLMYLCGAVILFYVLQWTIEWLCGYFGSVPGELTITTIAAVGALVTGLVLYRNDRVYHLANEVTQELKKVTWPNAKEVRTATIVVIVMSVISATILGLLFDGVWSKITELVYGG